MKVETVRRIWLVFFLLAAAGRLGGLVLFFDPKWAVLEWGLSLIAYGVLFWGAYRSDDTWSLWFFQVVFFVAFGRLVEAVDRSMLPLLLFAVTALPLFVYNWRLMGLNRRLQVERQPRELAPRWKVWEVVFSVAFASALAVLTLQWWESGFAFGRLIGPLAGVAVWYSSIYLYGYRTGKGRMLWVCQGMIVLGFAAHVVGEGFQLTGALWALPHSALLVANHLVLRRRRRLDLPLISEQPL